VDHLCPNCSLAVASGAPFCSACRAPQIRFVPAESVEAVVGADHATDEAMPATTPLAWRPAFRAAFLGGVFSALTMGIFGGLLGFGFMAGGTLSVYAYRRRVPGSALKLASGALLGAISGFFGFLLLAVLAAGKILFSHKGLRQTAFANMDRVVQNTDPQLQQSVLGVVEHLTPEGFVLFIAMSAVCACLMFVFFSVLGGAIGANITRRSPK
jgi:hypothetical protein